MVQKVLGRLLVRLTSELLIDDIMPPIFGFDVFLLSITTTGSFFKKRACSNWSCPCFMLTCTNRSPDEVGATEGPSPDDVLRPLDA